MHRGQQLTALGGAGLLIGAALPWVTASGPLGMSFSMAGFEGDGLITGAIGLALLLLAFISKGKPGKSYSIAAVIMAVVAGYLVANVLVNVSSYMAGIEETFITSAIGPGIYLSFAGCVLSLVGGFQKTPAAPQPVLAAPSDDSTSG